MALDFTDTNFEDEVINAAIPVVVDFSAAWCGPCRQLSPIIDELASEYEGKVKIGKVDIDKAQETAQRYGIMSVPTVVYFKGGQPVEKQIGLNAKAAYKQKIESLL